MSKLLVFVIGLILNTAISYVVFFVPEYESNYAKIYGSIGWMAIIVLFCYCFFSDIFSKQTLE